MYWLEVSYYIIVWKSYLVSTFHYLKFYYVF
jgi:hypothetical protein